MAEVVGEHDERFSSMDGLILPALDKHGAYSEVELPEVVIHAFIDSVGWDRATDIRVEFGDFAIKAAKGWLQYAETSALVRRREAGTEGKDQRLVELTDKGSRRLKEIRDSWNVVPRSTFSGQFVALYLPKFVKGVWAIIYGLALAGVSITILATHISDNFLTWLLLGLILLLVIVGLVTRIQKVRSTRRAVFWYWLARGDFDRFHAAWDDSFGRRSQDFLSRLNAFSQGQARSHARLEAFNRDLKAFNSDFEARAER